MNKSEFIKEIANKTGFTVKQASEACDAFISVIKDAMKSGEKLSITGFGSFEGKVRPARDAINPATGDRISLPETRIPAFKPAKLLKEELNK